MDDIDRIRSVKARAEPTPAELLDALTRLRLLRAELAGWEPELIEAARAAGVSWAELAPALGVTSRQAAERRFLRLQPRSGPAATKEDRVRAERTRRASDRAVQDWARSNSASLRRLAGRVGALDGHHADRVQDALGRDDAADLLGPLSEAHRHLLPEHAELAAEISDVTEQAARVRRGIAQRRARLRY